jgi:hypothetical protein
MSIQDLGNFWKLEKEFTPEENPYYPRKKELWETTIKKLFL